MTEPCSDSNERSTEQTDQPWRNEGELQRLYWDEMMSPREIAERWDCAQTTVNNWIGRHDIRKRTRQEACFVRDGTWNSVTFYTSKEGYERWTHGDSLPLVHRLLAVAEFGFEEVEDGEVHHKNSIKWDNRPENLEVFDSHSDHMRSHTKFSGDERLQIASTYELEDISSRDVGDKLGIDVGSTTVLSIHQEIYGDDHE